MGKLGSILEIDDNGLYWLSNAPTPPPHGNSVPSFVDHFDAGVIVATWLTATDEKAMELGAMGVNPPV